MAAPKKSNEAGPWTAKGAAAVRTSGTTRHRLAELRAEIIACRWLGYKVAWLYDQGQTPTTESSIIKVLTADLLYKLADLGSDILGYAGLLRGREALLGGQTPRQVCSRTKRGPWCVVVP